MISSQASQDCYQPKSACRLGSPVPFNLIDLCIHVIIQEMQLLVTNLWFYLSDSKRLELWRAQKEKKSASKRSATKAPWKGGGTPALKQKQTPNTCMSTGRKSVERKSSSSVRKEVKHSEQKKGPLSQNRFSTNKNAQDREEGEQCLMQSETEDVQVPVPPTNLSGAFDDDDDEHDDDVDGFNDQDVDEDGDDDGGFDNKAADRNLISRTETPMMSDDEDDDLIFNSSLETTEISSSQTNSESVMVPTPSSQSRKLKTPDRNCKSALQQVSKVARTEQKSVTFTTPLRCSPRLAKVGEGTGFSSATPKNKKDMRYSIWSFISSL